MTTQAAYPPASTFSTDQHTQKFLTSAKKMLSTTQNQTTTSGQSEGEHGDTAFPHLLFSASVVPPPEFKC